jgi:hypothetical protein
LFEQQGLYGMKMKATCSVAVIYQDPQAREIAVGYCDVLVQRFWHRCDFEVSWWSFQQVQDTPAAAKACGADLVVFVTCAGKEIPAGVKRWIDRWLTERANREGALVNLTDTSGPAFNPLTAKTDCYLRDVAHRGSLDYLTQVPAEIFGLIPESAESWNDRARQMTTVLDEILHRPAVPRHL